MKTLMIDLVCRITTRITKPGVKTTKEIPKPRRTL